MTFVGSLVLLASVCICSCYGSDITLWTSYDISDNAGPGLDVTSSCNKTENVTSGATLAPPYEDLIGCDTWTRVVTITDGYAIDVTVESMDVGQDDYLTINAGGRRLVDTSVPVFTGKIRTPRKIRALTSPAVFIEFVAQPRNDTQYTGFTLTFQKYGEITTSTEMSTEASTLPVAPQSVNAEFTVYLSGLTPVVFAQNITEFKTAVKGMAVSFCTVNNINIIDNITEKNVIISYAVQCPITWPNSDKCVQVTMSIPIIVLNDTAYEMTTIHLYQMWNQYSARDALLQELGLKVYSVPRTEVTMYTWMGVSLGCLAIFAIILVMVWRLDIFTNHSDRLSGVSESQPKMSTTSQKSWIELPYQEFPPMGVDDFPEYEPDNLHTGKGAHINLHPLPSPTPKLPSYGPPQEYGAALHFFPTSFDNQALIEKDDDIYQKRDRNTSTS